MQEEEDTVDQTVSESVDVVPHEESNAEPEQKMVPLSALEAERKKRQEAEAKSQMYQEYAMRNNQPQKPAEDDSEALVEKKDLRQETAMTKREILEQVYQDVNPEAVQKINKYLPKLLERKPFLADTIENAQNRYARAYEVVNDYMHLIEDKPEQKIRVDATKDAARLVQNAQKPRSPVEIGKSQKPAGMEYLKSIQGKSEFREYRKKVLNGES